MSKNQAGGSYSAGHPWYYLLNGRIRGPKQILDDVIKRGYQGYLAEDIQKANAKPEPQRSDALRRLKDKAMNDLQRDLRHYREFSHKLRNRRKQFGPADYRPVCEDIHVSISLKYCHVYNDLAHLNFLNELFSHQPDLFGP